MTDNPTITERDLARIERRAADSDERDLTPYWRYTVPALVAALREAREQLRVLMGCIAEHGIPCKDCESAVRRAARIVGEPVAESGVET